jgi:hypothetical protein
MRWCRGVDNFKWTTLRVVWSIEDYLCIVSYLRNKDKLGGGSLDLS